MCLYIIGKHWGSFLSHCILLLHQSMHRLSITFLQKTMRMGMMGMHPLGQHHLGDMCLTRHFHLNHRLKTKVKVETLIPWFCWNQPLQGRLLLNHCLTIFMPLRHLPGDLPLGMILIPCINSLILILLISISMIREQSFMRTEKIHLLHHKLDMTT